MEEEKKDIKPIDFTQIVKKLWPHRKKYYYVLPIVLIATYLLMVCIPRYYKCTVCLAPEATGPSMSGSLGSLASSIGLAGSLAKMAGEDAISAEIYPDVIGSLDFIAELMNVPVSTRDKDINCEYYVYLRDKQKSAWWSKLFNTIGEWVKPTTPDTYNGKETLSVFELSKRQKDIFSYVQSNIKCVVDKKTDVVSITVTDQDPRVCAIMADATCKKLQEFIIAYRTNKARVDVAYYEKLAQKSKADYDKALKDYMAYSDAHTSSVLTAYQAHQESLENEMQAKYNVYTAMSTQLQAATAKLQETTPAFTVIESASMPIKPAGPKRMIISIAMMLLAFFVLTGWLLAKKDLAKDELTA